MTISSDVRRQFFLGRDNGRDRVIRLPPPTAAPVIGPTKRQGRPWTQAEHERFLEGLERYPMGPWVKIAAHVATRTTRQTMTHAQKYRQRIARHTQPKRPRRTARNRTTKVETTSLTTIPACSIQAGPLDLDSLDMEILAATLLSHGDDGIEATEFSFSNGQLTDQAGDPCIENELLHLIEHLEVIEPVNLEPVKPITV